jgi:probable HAF family extracellular repeat protein
LRGFFRSPSGDYTAIDFPASEVPQDYPTDEYIQTMPIRVSPDGTVIGCFHHLGNDYHHTMHGFVYSDGHYEFLPVDGTMHNGLTPDGRVIVGVWYPDLTHYHSYMVAEGVYTTFDPPGAVISAAWDINEKGEIVGSFTDASGVTHGYLLSQGRFFTIDFPNAMMTQLRGINPRGDLVGFYMDQENLLHGFLATR